MPTRTAKSCGPDASEVGVKSCGGTQSPTGPARRFRHRSSCAPLSAHGKPPCEHTTRPTPRRPPHPVPTFGDDGQRPFLRDRMAGVLKMICPTTEGKFCPSGYFVAVRRVGTEPGLEGGEMLRDAVTLSSFRRTPEPIIPVVIMWRGRATRLLALRLTINGP